LPLEESKARQIEQETGAMQQLGARELLAPPLALRGLREGEAFLDQRRESRLGRDRMFEDEGLQAPNKLQLNVRFG
jgi:hypothetical protein